MTEFNKGIVLRFMKRGLGQIIETEPRLSRLMCKTIELLAEAGLYKRRHDDIHDEFSSLKPDAPDKLLISLTEGYQQLLTLGYIIPKPSPPNAPNPDWFYITDNGREWAAGQDPIPEDSRGYRSALTTIVPDIDTVIMQYVQEALISYERRAFFAAAVMIGAASEKTVYLLIHALHNSIQNPNERTAIQRAMDRRTLPSMFDRISDNLERAKAAELIPYQVHEGADRHLLSLYEMIRVQRNEAVHPTAARVTPETVRLSLSAFPAACRKAYDLIDWLDNNQI